jgi:hypothetical protein
MGPKAIASLAVLAGAVGLALWLRNRARNSTRGDCPDESYRRVDDYKFEPESSQVPPSEDELGSIALGTTVGIEDEPTVRLEYEANQAKEAQGAETASEPAGEVSASEIESSPLEPAINSDDESPTPKHRGEAELVGPEKIMSSPIGRCGGSFREVPLKSARTVS